MNRTRAYPLLAGLAGALITMLLFAVLFAAGLFERSDPAPSTAAAPAPVGGSSATNAGRVYESAREGVVSVQARRTEVSASPLQSPGGGGGTATGSGFVLDDEGYVITNAHVVDGARSVTIRPGEEDDRIEAEVVGSDLDTDIALLKVSDADARELQSLPLADSARVRVGDQVVAIGNPFRLDRTATAGIVSALGRPIEAPSGFSINDAIQTDAAINPGNSGGPLLDSAGRVIGVNSQIATGGANNGNVGIGFAVPVNTVKRVVPDLKEDGEVSHSYMGVATTEVTPEAARELDLRTQDGALLGSVTAGGPAADAGLRARDVLLEVDGQRVARPDDVAAAIADDQPGEEVEVTYQRGGDRRTATVRLEERPERAPESG